MIPKSVARSLPSGHAMFTRVNTRVNEPGSLHKFLSIFFFLQLIGVIPTVKSTTSVSPIWKAVRDGVLALLEV